MYTSKGVVLHLYPVKSAYECKILEWNVSKWIRCTYLLFTIRVQCLVYDIRNVNGFIWLSRKKRKSLNYHICIYYRTDMSFFKNSNPWDKYSDWIYFLDCLPFFVFVSFFVNQICKLAVQALAKMLAYFLECYHCLSGSTSTSECWFWILEMLSLLKLIQKMVEKVDFIAINAY